MLLNVKKLKTHYQTEQGVVKAVDGISLAIAENEVFGLAGESGCGKSTTCLAIAKLRDPTDGSILYKGTDISRITGQEINDYRSEVQIIFQDPYESLNPRFTTFDLVAEPLRALKLVSRAKLRQRVYEILSMVGLKPEEYQNRYPHQMSGGERQRVGIAQALVVKPELVIADEPLSMLDVSIRAGVLDLIRDLSARMRFSCIYVSHDLSILSNISERLIIMYLGKIVELAETRQVITDPLHPYARALISAVPIPDPAYQRPVPDIKGDVSQPIDPPPGCRFQGRCPRVMDVCKIEDPRLEEIKPGHLAACHIYSRHYEPKQ
ncbi:MAG: ABC transporter ATP-binding protein [Deltaproteobacteria bacterium]|nr:ABC transporter ATP-binding protein [Deltaproteobacteria bacterium]